MPSSPTQTVERFVVDDDALFEALAVEVAHSGTQRAAAERLGIEMLTNPENPTGSFMLNGWRYRAKPHERDGAWVAELAFPQRQTDD